jgi:hypothetical protein
MNTEYDEDLQPVHLLELDNVLVDIPAEVTNKHEKDVLSEMMLGDSDGQIEIQRLMDDRRALNNKLQTDPEFDKRYKQAELEYFDKVNGTDNHDLTTPNDELFRQAQALVEKMHHKSENSKKSEPEPKPSQSESTDPHGLSRFGKVLNDVPPDSKPDHEINLNLLNGTKSDSATKIVFKNVNNIVINYYNR